MNELTVAEVLATLRARLAPLAECEAVDLAAGINRVLAADVVSAVDLPAFDNAAMDGYAIRAEDAGAPVTLTIVGHALAGHAYAGRVERGQAVRTMTGAALPAGADAVVMSEDTEAAGGDVRVLRAVHARGRTCDAAASTCAPARPCCSPVAGSGRTTSGWPPASAPTRSR